MIALLVDYIKLPIKIKRLTKKITALNLLYQAVTGSRCCDKTPFVSVCKTQALTCLSVI